MPTLRTAHTVMSVSRSAGGLQGAVLNLARTLVREQKTTVDVLALQDEFSAADVGTWDPLQPKVFPTVGPRAFGFAPEMLPAMLDSKVDVVHCHGLWLYPGIATLRWQGRTGRPYIVSPHGMLEAQFELKHSRFKKNVAWMLYQGRHLRRAHCLHALCDAERQDIRKAGLKVPVCVISNGVDLPSGAADPTPPWAGVVADGKKVLLYLSRINPKKGLGALIRGWVEARRDNPRLVDEWALVVVGFDQARHRAELESLIEEEKLGESIKFLGGLYGRDKEAAYGHADAFVLPSLSEGLPLVVPEAWAHGLPVLMTPQCNLPEGVSSGAAVCVPPVPHDLASGLLTLFGMSDAERASMGERGRRLVIEKFAWPRIAAQMREVYEWALGGGTPPSTVEQA